MEDTAALNLGQSAPVMGETTSQATQINAANAELQTIVKDLNGRIQELEQENEKLMGEKATLSSQITKWRDDCK